MDDETLRAALHDVVAADGNLDSVIGSSGADKAQAQRVLDQVIADYVAELNRALAEASGSPYGVDATIFMRQYDRLLATKLAV